MCECKGTFEQDEVIFNEEGQPVRIQMQCQVCGQASTFTNSELAINNITEILNGITLSEPDGWWDTSKGVEFGIDTLKKVIYFLHHGKRMPRMPKFIIKGEGERHM